MSKDKFNNTELITMARKWVDSFKGTENQIYIKFSEDDLIQMGKNIVELNKDKLIESLWDEFKDIPTDTDNEVIESDFHIWFKGEYVTAIQSWFNNNHSKGIRFLVYERE